MFFAQAAKAIGQDPAILGPLSGGTVTFASDLPIIHAPGHVLGLDLAEYAVSPQAHDFRMVGCPSCASMESEFLAAAIEQWDRLDAKAMEEEYGYDSSWFYRTYDPRWAFLGSFAPDQMRQKLEEFYPYPFVTDWTDLVHASAVRVCQQLTSAYLDRFPPARVEEYALVSVKQLHRQSAIPWARIVPIRSLAGSEFAVIGSTKRSFDEAELENNRYRQLNLDRFSKLPASEEQWEFISLALSKEHPLPMAQMIESFEDAINTPVGHTAKVKVAARSASGRRP